jgi:protease PrsW
MREPADRIPLAMNCATCGADMPPDARFCSACGSGVTAVASIQGSTPAFGGAKAAGAQWSALVAQFKALPIDALFPFRRWAEGKLWSGPIVRAVLFFALFPLALSAVLGQDIAIENAAWAIGVYFALLWGWVVYAIARPARVNYQYLVGIAAFTVLVGIPIDLFVQRFPIISSLYGETDTSVGLGALLGFLCVGVVEESVKQLPVWWLALRSRVLTTPRETAFYGAMSGLAFGVSEAVTYSLTYANQAILGANQFQSTDVEGNFIVSEFLRLISLPFLHAMFSAIAGYFVGLAVVSPSRRAALVITGLALAAVVHGLYDTTSGPSPWLALLVAAVAVLLFVGYLSNAESLSQQLEERGPTQT